MFLSFIWVGVLTYLISHYRPSLINNFFKILFLSFPLGLFASFLGECMAWLMMGIEYRPSATLPGTMHWAGAAVLMSGVPIVFSFMVLLGYSHRMKRKKIVSKVKQHEAQLDEVEGEQIKIVLSEYEHIDLVSVPNNLALEERISDIPTEEVIERLDSRMFSEDALPSVLRVLNRRLVNDNSKP